MLHFALNRNIYMKGKKTILPDQISERGESDG